MARKRRKSRKKTYSSKAAAKRAAKRRPGSWRMYKVKGGYRLSKRKKR